MKKCFIPVFVSFLLVLFSSCDSFLDGSTLKSQLDEKIEEASSEKSILYFEVDNNYGSFLSTASVEIRKGKQIDIQFSWNPSDYIFDGFCVFDYDTKKIVNDAVLFPALSENDKTTGLYKTNISIKDSSRSLVLKPLCTTKNDRINPVIESAEFFAPFEQTCPFYRQLSTDFYKTEDAKTDELYSQNHVRAFKYNLMFSDNNNEIAGLVIRETPVTDKNGIEISGAASSEIRIPYNGFSTGEVNAKGEKIFSFEENKEYNFNAEADGVIKLELFAEDKNGNLSSPYTIYVVKDCYIKDQTIVLKTEAKRTVKKSNPLLDDLSFSEFKINCNSYLSNKISNILLDIKIKNESDSDFTQIYNSELIEKNKWKSVSDKVDFCGQLNKLVSGFEAKVHEAKELVLIARDEAGNSLTLNGVIPKDVRFLFNSGNYLYFNRYDGSYNGEVYKTKILHQYSSDNLEYSPLIDSRISVDDNNQVFRNLSQLESGKAGYYRVYAVKYSNPVTGIELTGCPVDYYEVPYNVTPVTESLPKVDSSSIKFTEHELVPNEGSVHFTVDFDEPENSEGCEFIIKAVAPNNAAYYSLPENLTLPALNSYSVSVITKKGSSSSVSTAVNLDISDESYDNYPPTGLNIIYKDNKCLNFNGYYTVWFNDEDGDYKEYDKISKKVQYWIIPSIVENKISDTELLSLSGAEDFEEIPFGGEIIYKGTAEIESDKKFKIPVKNLKNGKYNLRFKLSKSFNYRIINCFTLQRTVCFETPVCSLSDSALNISFTPYSSDFDAFVTVSNLVDSEWKSIKQYDSNSNETGDLIDKTKFDLISMHSKFIKVTGSFVKSEITNAEKIIAVTRDFYVCPDYYRGACTVKNKNWITGLENGIQVFCDSPVLIHTMYSNSLLTAGTGVEQAAVWETDAKETGFLIETASFTYDNSLLDGVEQNSYYTTICHFADGTILMTEPKLKR